MRERQARRRNTRNAHDRAQSGPENRESAAHKSRSQTDPPIVDTGDNDSRHAGAGEQDTPLPPPFRFFSFFSSRCISSSCPIFFVATGASCGLLIAPPPPPLPRGGVRAPSGSLPNPSSPLQKCTALDGVRPLSGPRGSEHGAANPPGRRSAPRYGTRTRAHGKRRHALPHPQRRARAACRSRTRRSRRPFPCARPRVRHFAPERCGLRRPFRRQQPPCGARRCPARRRPTPQRVHPRREEGGRVGGHTEGGPHGSRAHTEQGPPEGVTGPFPCLPVQDRERGGRMEGLTPSERGKGAVGKAAQGRVPAVTRRLALQRRRTPAPGGPRGGTTTASKHGPAPPRLGGVGGGGGVHPLRGSRGSTDATSATGGTPPPALPPSRRGRCRPSHDSAATAARHPRAVDGPPFPRGPTPNRRRLPAKADGSPPKPPPAASIPPPTRRTQPPVQPTSP